MTVHGLAVRDAAALIFAADMYGVQLDQLAALTRGGLAACGLGYSPARPALSRLAHIRAVATARIALEATSGFQRAAAFWRCERRIRSRHGVGVRQHLPDAEAHWPDGPAPGSPDRAAAGWAGECWAVEAEASP